MDLLMDDPAAIMKELYGYIETFVINDDEIFDQKHLEAWDFFTDTIGIEYSTIYNRYRNAPELFIPSHMLSRYNITPLIELYNEAVRTYIFGLTEASVAMCRALLEHILKQYYHISGDNLGRIISEAEGRYRHLRGLNLRSKNNLANQVLHNYEKREQEIEKAAYDFLQTIRHMVTGVTCP